MMKKMKRKGIAGILSAVLIIAGACLIGTPDSKVFAQESIPNIDQFLTVKWQMSEESENGTKNLRIVTTIDADEEETYGNVGFNITFLEQGNEKEVVMDHTVDSVFHRIDANEGGIEYAYGPKAFHATSEWLATCTITKIPEKYWDNGIVIKPYVTMKGESTKIWGQHRYLTMKDQENNVITIPVEGELDITGIEPNDYATFDCIHKQDGFTHVRLQVSDLKSLPSISEYTVIYDGGSQEVKYRYLLASKTSDSSWYDLRDGTNAAVIVTASEMRNFQELSKTNDFELDTIYLGADIDLNPGFDALKYSYLNNVKTDENGATTRPSNSNDWTPIGYSGNNGESTTTAASNTYPKFAGTFDGNMHSISGVFMLKWAKSEQGMGLFGEVEGATIKNFTLKNSYCFVSITANTKSYTGSVVGVLNNSTLDTVKCDEDVVVEIEKATEYNGGMVGASKGTSTISNCWFAGKIDGKGYRLGGISGGMSVSGSSCTVKNCLVTGDIRAEQHVGGIFGTAWTNTTLILKDSLFAGTIKNANDAAPTTSGTVIDDVNKITPDVSDVYVRTYEDSVLTNVVGAGSANVPTEDITQYSTDELTGTTGYLNMNVGFYMSGINEEAKWLAVDDGYPVLASFSDKTATNIINLTEVQKVRTVWYNSTGDTREFVLYTPADFRGFQELSKTYNFELDTIYLGADIDLNPGFDALKYSYLNNVKTDENGATTRPSNSNDWTPIGYSGNNGESTTTAASNTYPKFAGTFDGNMHSISGVFMLKWAKSEQGMGLFGEVEGATIKNFTLKNSYCFVSITANTKSYTGSVVGVLNNSTLDTVKCDEDVVVEIEKATEYNGGMVGASKGTSTISNCWFAGKIDGKGYRLGGISGGMSVSGSSCTVKNCLVTGDIRAEQHVGGIFGTAWTNTTLILKDSLFAGTIKNANDAAPTTSGTVIDDVNKITPDVSNVYVRIDEEEVLHGTIGAGSSNVSEGAIVRLDPEELILDDARDNTELKIYPQDKDISFDGSNKEYWWYVSEKYPILASFGTPMTYTKLKVATYNIGYCEKLGTDTSIIESVLGQVAAFIEDNEIDVCLLQEVRQENGTNHADQIANQIEGYTSYFKHTVTTDVTKKEGGIAILSKYPIVGEAVFTEIEDEDSNEPRGILKIVIDMDQDNVGDAAVLCTHFDNNADVDTKTPAIDTLSLLVEEIQAETPNMPIVFGGDLNIPYAADNANLNEIGKFLTSTTAGRNANTHYLDMWYQFDYIFRNEKFTQGYTAVGNPVDSDTEQELSDHRPLVVNLYMNINK